MGTTQFRGPQDPPAAELSTSRFRLGFARKVALLVVATTVLTASLLAVSSYLHVRRIAEDQGLDKLRGSAALLVPYVQDEFSDIMDDLQLIAQGPPLRGIARALENGGVDPEYGISERVWRERLVFMFGPRLRFRPHYTRLRLIAASESGHELVRVDRVDGGPVIRQGDELQPIADRNYFADAMRLSAGEIAFSTVDRASYPGDEQAIVPATLRGYMNVRNENGNVFALLVIDASYIEMLQRVSAAAPVDADVYIVDGDGNFLVSAADGTTEFGFSDQEIETEAGHIAGHIRDQGKTAGAFRHAHAGYDVRVAHVVAFDNGPGGKPLRVGLSMRESTLFAEADALGYQNAMLAVIAILLGLIVAVLASRRLIRPVQQTGRALAAYADRRQLTDLPVGVNDEIGDFARAFTDLIRQIGESRAAERQAFEQLDAIVHNSIEGIMILDHRGRVKSMNPASLDMFGYDGADVSGLPMGQFLTDDSFSESDGLIHLALNGANFERSTLREVVGVTKSGQTIDLEITMSLVPLPCSMSIVAVFMRDIRKRKAAERKLRRFSLELEQSNQQLANANEKLTSANADLHGFTYIVSHDLRAPLVNLMGFSGQLTKLVARLKDELRERLATDLPSELAQLIDDRIPKALNFINSSGDKMQRQLDIILRLSRLGGYEMKPERVNLNAVFESVVKLHEHSDRVEINLDHAPEIIIDRDAINIVVTNLVSNAVKYADPARELQVTVDAEWDEQSITLCVSDNGRGMREEDTVKVYALFRRVGRQDTSGEGIGLAFVRRVLTRLNGSIWCESKEGRGTKFYVKVPRDSAARGDVTEAA